ncbi:hypothetical protein XENTR_v10023721 [Xenopus tropicalis]|uniref:Glutamate rich 1 n=1 Tax=Xenopus tropicalis TaxID=8364 RepID=B0BM71_XENTR|nr:glutamate-rich protein 1 [Xenopus tropicalis]AAI58313.1 LOC100144976 protein [Xenopus tropicalis]KAE8578665.1 hypothetical protein XENTR_v10023721 [Xenopus tropicalis]|eukprot:NP_001120014.1 glutamate-rich protein 1 [Xenopus tropicalis]
MSSNRRNVFVSNVLKRLYPEEDISGCTPRVHGAKPPPESKAKAASSQEDTVQVQVVFPPEELLKAPKVYTVLPPPEGYVASSQHESKCSSPSSSNDEDTRDEDLNTTRKRRRRKKNKKSSNLLNPEMERNSTQAETPWLASDRSAISKSKKRKLQRKRQKERTKATRTDGTDPPSKGDSEGVDKVKDTGGAASEEDQRDKAKDLMEFLQETQEIYLMDRCADSAVSIHGILDILGRMEAGDFPSSDVTLLHQVKTLLLLQDTDRSEEALDNFKASSSLPADQRLAIYSLFRYWIIHILPLRRKE